MNFDQPEPTKEEQLRSLQTQVDEIFTEAITNRVNAS